MDRNYCVYCHTAPNGKKYIGLTGDDVERRWRKGNGYPNNRHFTAAINKYGWDNFSHDILISNLTLDEAKEYEKRYIAQFKTNNARYGYNLTDGGEGISGVKFSKETREKLSQKKKGYKFSQEHNRKISEALKGVPKSESQKIKQRMTMTGRKASEETKRKFSEMRKGSDNPRYGKHCSEETKAKISAALKGREIPEHQRKITSELFRKELYCYELDTVFKSYKEFANHIGCDCSTVSQAINGHHGNPPTFVVKGYHIKTIQKEEKNAV